MHLHQREWSKDSSFMSCCALYVYVLLRKCAFKMCWKGEKKYSKGITAHCCGKKKGEKDEKTTEQGSFVFEDIKK